MSGEYPLPSTAKNGVNITMANSPQARKRIRQSERKADQNILVRSRMRTEVKKLEKAITASDKDTIGMQFPITMAALQKAAGKGVIKKEAASRKVSRLANRVKGLSA